MKLTINAEELREWDACASGVRDFESVHSDKTVPLECALESNSVKDFLYVFFRNKKEFSDRQVKDIKLLLCEYAERVLYIFEEKYPEDDRPRKAIDVARKYINGDAATDVDAAYAAAAYAAAAYAADAAATDAAYAAAYAADAAATDAAYAADAAATDAAYATDADAREKEALWQKQRLIEVIKLWYEI